MLECVVVPEHTGIKKETFTEVIFLKASSLFCSALEYFSFLQPIQIKVLSFNGNQHREISHMGHIYFINVLKTLIFF